jgi:hypothetical protein
MSDEPKKSKLKLYIYYLMMGSGITLFLFSANALTVDEAVVPASCDIILNPMFAIPESVITKGYDIIRFENGTESEKSCYYIKNAGLVERGIYGWSLYE